MNALSIQPTDVIRALQSQHVPRVIWVVNLLLVICLVASSSLVAQTKMKSTFIKFQTEAGKLFVIMQSNHFTGIIEWTRKFGATMAKSKAIFQELLDSLEIFVVEMP